MANTPSHNIGDPRPYDPAWQLEYDLNGALRVQGAMRALSNMLQPWKSGEEVDISGVSREDLASLFEVLAEKLDERLQAATDSMLAIQGFHREACTLTDRAKRGLTDKGTKP